MKKRPTFQRKFVKTQKKTNLLILKSWICSAKIFQTGIKMFYFFKIQKKPKHRQNHFISGNQFQKGQMTTLTLSGFHYD